MNLAETHETKGSSWRTVTSAKPCPICGKPDWCGVSENGEAVICMRVMSNHATRNGGWLHLANDTDRGHRYIPPPPDVKKEERQQDWEKLWQGWRTLTKLDDVDALAYGLGVSVEAMEALGAAWAPEHSAWAFPMMNAQGTIVGIRLRSERGGKWAVKGSKAGLMYQRALTGTLGGFCLICEGPTDTAAAMDLGFTAVGRPSCKGQEQMVREFLYALQVKDPIIVADRDGPGQDGARLLAERLKRPCRIIIPPKNDIREWVKAGATKAEVLALTSSAGWVNVR